MFTPDAGGISCHESIVALMVAYPDNKSALRFFEEERWPDGVDCPFCASRRVSPIPSRLRHRCLDCGREFSVRTNSVFGDTRLPLHLWMYAMYFMDTSRKGISSYALAKHLGITQKSAWFVQHRIREAMSDDFQPKLSGVVEVDEAYIGGREGWKHARKKLHAGALGGKQPVVGFRQRGGPVVAYPVEEVDLERMTLEMKRNVELGSSVYTDDSGIYGGIGELYRHRSVVHSRGQYVDGDVTTNSIESVWAVVKRGYRGVYHHWHPKNTRRYLYEFTFRLNQKGSTMEALSAIVRGAVGKRLTYEVLTREDVHERFGAQATRTRAFLLSSQGKNPPPD